MLCIPVTSVLKFTLLSHYRRSFPLRISLVNVSKTAAVCSHLLKRFLAENFIFCTVTYPSSDPYSSVFNPLKEYNDKKDCHIWVCSTEEKCIKKYFRYLLFYFQVLVYLIESQILMTCLSQKNMTIVLITVSYTSLLYVP